MRKKTNGAQRAGQNITRSDVPYKPVSFQDRPKSQQHADAPVGTTHAASRASKSLMKTSDLATRGGLSARPGAKPLRPATNANARQGKSSAKAHHHDRKQKVEERIAAASEELIAGITEAASASEELRRAMEQISTGAEEAASASQETFAVATTTADDSRAGTRPRGIDASADGDIARHACGNLEPNRGVGEQHQTQWWTTGCLGFCDRTA